MALYRCEFRARAVARRRADAVHVIAGITAIADDDAQRAQQQRHAAKLQRISTWWATTGV